MTRRLSVSETKRFGRLAWDIILKRLFINYLNSCWLDSFGVSVVVAWGRDFSAKYRPKPRQRTRICQHPIKLNHVKKLVQYARPILFQEQGVNSSDLIYRTTLSHLSSLSETLIFLHKGVYIRITWRGPAHVPLRLIKCLQRSGPPPGALIHFSASRNRS